MFKKSGIILAVLLITLSLLFSGCSSGDDNTGPENSGTEANASVSEEATTGAVEETEEEVSGEQDSEPDDVTEGEIPAGSDESDNQDNEDPPSGDESRGEPTEQPVEVTFQAGSPVSEFTSRDIEYLNINFSGTDQEIAEAIRQWQASNMIYASPDLGYDDASDPIRWNYFLPGIWTSKDIIYDHVDNGKVYGICHDYAIIYASIAEYYGLETRIVNTLSKPSDSMPEPAEPGMAVEEYNRNKARLISYDLNYSYDAISAVAYETPTHYWAEVYLGGQWVVMDASQVSTGGSTINEFIANDDYEITDWTSWDKTSTLETFPPAIMVDDLGQIDRATSMGEVIQGLSFAPYLNSAQDAVEFANASAYMSSQDINEMLLDKQLYEACSGKKLYLISYIMCDGEELSGQDWVDRYEETCGEPFDTDCGAYLIEGE